MILWVDAQLSPALASWITESLGGLAHHMLDLGLLRASDQAIYYAAREAGAAILTKDRDFLVLSERLGPPPQVVRVTCGNTSNDRLRDILQGALPMALNLLEEGESSVEISDAD